DGVQKQAYETGRNQLIRALGSNPDNLALMSARSQVELALENTTMATEIAHQVLQKDPNQLTALDVLLRIAVDTQDTRRLEEIRKSLGEAIDNDPDNGSLRLMHIQALSALKLPQIAIDELEAYCQTEPGRDNANAFVRLASLYRQIGDMDQAEQKLDQAERLAPDSAALVGERVNWATTLSQSGKADQAETLFRELLAKHPVNTSIMNNLAWLLQDQYQRYEEALELVNQGLSQSPDDLYLLDTRGTILLKMTDRLAEAKLVFTRLVELSPEDARRQVNSLLQLGRVCAKLSEFAQATQHLRQALRINEEIDVLTPEERSEIAKIMERQR
ncbi:MAG: tetratricopeptide repeat protein, partial [Planctomycetes bacterium]|nr:tetratricopeptide repeat protein [Planctomycetota bacterium]